MGFFDDFTNALETYPETGVQLEVVQVSFPDSVLAEHGQGQLRPPRSCPSGPPAPRLPRS
ncbi:MAG TPA: hypothetical protein VLR51_05275 [Actinomycetes bacterium]|nr:hypothetical protein [Actinomycetes bacterium]